MNRHHFSGCAEIVLLYEYPSVIKHKEIIKLEDPKITTYANVESKQILEKFIEAANNILEKL